MIRNMFSSTLIIKLLSCLERFSITSPQTEVQKYCVTMIKVWYSDFNA